MFDFVVNCKIFRPFLRVLGEGFRPGEGLGAMEPSQLVVFNDAVTIKKIIAKT